MSDDLDGVLCPEEKARAGRLLSERDRRLWSRSRGVLRALLGRYLGRDPGALRFSVGAHGKPELLEHPAGSTGASQPASPKVARLSFNLSHSGGIGLYAITEAGPVGVDIEVARRPIKEIALAARTFGPAEARRLQALDPAVREREFLRAWVRHEAELKCRGTGIGAAAAGPNGREPWIAELEVGPRAAGAVAVAVEVSPRAGPAVTVEEPPRELPINHLDLSCWEWVPPPRPAARRGRYPGGGPGSL